MSSFASQVRLLLDEGKRANEFADDMVEMKAKQQKSLKEILWETLELEPQQRLEFLLSSGIAANDRAEIESLLAFEAASADFMSLPITEFSKDFVAKQDELEINLIGQEIGVYRITDELGLGGMGAVYLAERTDGKFEQKVAVKMLKRELNVEKIRQAFNREKKILSKLNHPMIARLLDAGSTDDGVPFFVMEHVEGVPIDQFCENNNLTLTARLKLFNRVCEAVSFAHRNLIIHRDLKPGNILVTQKGEPKLLDFGISKILDAEENTLITAFGAMTPEYAAPEQIRGESVSTATDIYSLGVVLYKILTGSLPFQSNGKTNGELLKIITEEEPTAPSAISNLKSQISNNGQAPKSKKPNLHLKGDLDNIILKALSKEPERRYKTVEHFSADIWRHIDGLPVLARPVTFSYRASKFFRRNKISVIAAALIFLSLIGGITVAFWQAREARAQANLAIESQSKSEIETEKAKEEQRKSEKIMRFMSKIIGYANPQWYAEGAKFGKDARVIDAILDMSEKIDVEFAAEPDVAAELHHRFSEVIGFTNARSLTLEEQKARRLFHARRALELRKQFYGEKHELVAKDMVYLYWARGIEESQRAQYLMEAIQMMRETNPSNLNLPYMFEAYAAYLMLPEHEQLHEQYRKAIYPPTDENKYQIAERMLREALPIWRLHYPPDHGVIVSKTCWLAYALAEQDKWAEFDEPYQICKQGNERLMQEGIVPDDVRNGVVMVENALVEKTR